MKTFIFALTLVVLSITQTTPSQALSCQEIRGYIASYGKEFVIAQARARGVSDATIRRLSRQCGV